MPSSNTLTTIYSFTANTVIRSSEVNTMFSNWRGHLIPIDPTATSSPSLTYDLGGQTHEWRGVYGQYNIMYGNTAASVPASPASGYMAFYFKSDGKAYKKNSSGTENEMGGGALVVTGTRAAPSTITVSGITFVGASGARQMWFITGDTTTGTDITANPQISVGTDVGQELYLIGRDDTRPVIFDDSNGLSLNGTLNLGADNVLALVWDSSVWVELFRR